MSKFYNETLELYTVCKSNETLENLLKYIADHFKYAYSDILYFTFIKSKYGRNHYAL